jgi:hypothetical protein
MRDLDLLRSVCFKGSANSEKCANNFLGFFWHWHTNFVIQLFPSKLPQPPFLAFLSNTNLWSSLFNQIHFYLIPHFNEAFNQAISLCIKLLRVLK